MSGEIIRQKFNEINWIKILIEVTTLLAFVVGAAFLLGDGRYASKETTEKILTQVTAELAQVALRFELHTADSAAHWTAGQVQEVVTRPEWDRSTKELKEELRDLRREQADFWREQRAVNNALLRNLQQN